MNTRDAIVVQMPDDEIVGNGEAITRCEYWALRSAQQRTVTPPTMAAEQPASAPHDSYTVDAEIVLDRLGVSDFTAVDLAALLDLSFAGVRKRLRAGNIPIPRWIGSTESHRWTRGQVVEILADHLRRRESFTTAELAQLLGVVPTTVKSWVQSGRVPEPRYPSAGPNSHRWTPEQTLEIVALIGSVDR